ncbi:hypothetical protein LTS18_001149, partial [Coniosporium uncinatum]
DNASYPTVGFDGRNPTNPAPVAINGSYAHKHKHRHRHRREHDLPHRKRAAVRDVQADHKIVARAIARDGIVLLKNEGKTLPLAKPESIAIIGEDAAVNPDGANACPDRGCTKGHLAMGWGSGTAEFPYLIDPLSAISERAKQGNGTKIISSPTNDPEAGLAAAKAAATAIIFVNANSGEGYLTVEGNAGDRNDLDPWHRGNELVAAVSKAQVPTIVVVHSVGPIILESILAQPNIKAVVWAGLPGQESGNALVDVLYGEYNPSGKLPFTIAKKAGDYNAPISKDKSDDFTDGLYIDYRHFDQEDLQVRYEFGFGMCKFARNVARE